MKKKIVLLRKFWKDDLNYILDNISKDYKVIVPDDFSDENLSRVVIDAEVTLIQIQLMLQNLQ